MSKNKKNRARRPTPSANHLPKPATEPKQPLSETTQDNHALPKTVRDWYDEEINSVAKLFRDSGENGNTSAPFRAIESPFFEGAFSQAMEAISTARSIYMNDIKELLTLVLALFVGVATIDYFAFTTDEKAFGAVLFVVGFSLTTFLLFSFRPVKAKLRAAYEYYAAAALNAAILGKASGLGHPHQWLTYVENSIKRIESDYVSTKTDNAQKGKQIRGREWYCEQLEWKNIVINEWTYNDWTWEYKDTPYRSLNLRQASELILGHVRTAVFLGLALEVFLFHIHFGPLNFHETIPGKIFFVGEGIFIACALISFWLSTLKDEKMYLVWSGEDWSMERKLHLRRVVELYHSRCAQICAWIVIAAGLFIALRIHSQPELDKAEETGTEKLVSDAHTKMEEMLTSFANRISEEVRKLDSRSLSPAIPPTPLTLPSDTSKSENEKKVE